ncbi:zinc finger protein ZXDC isoform X1 [Xenopus laevis]|uniref:Zinc finger protein ZXDC isoform X1 n=1 Tax=Xenopus laevis TaxID=8355 RepID=A0A8J0V2Q1_XENLA|nr:zinc finger protein ZXDC isoform X1 [Xenopus laevis]
MEIQGPADQRQQDGGQKFPAQAGSKEPLDESSDEEEKQPGPDNEAEDGQPVYMLLNLSEEAAAAPAVSGDLVRPGPSTASSSSELGLPGYLTVRLENGVLTLGGRRAEGSDLAEPQASDIQSQQVWASELEGGSSSGAAQRFPEDLEDVDLVLRDSEDEQVAGFLVGEIGELQVNLGEALDLARKGVLLVFRCPEPGCAKAFDRKQQLKVHLLSHTEGERPFKCTVANCGWAFTTLYKLKRHVQTHDKQRPFSCDVPGCAKSFTTVYNLKAHLKAHEQENLFRCDTCGETFSASTKLSAHRRIHFEPERPYKCEFSGCDKTFITVTALFSHHRAHVREQEQFFCSFPGCNKQYDKACRLKIHLRSHTGERPFICDYEGCGWTFTSMSKLLRHKRKHEDDRRYPCPVQGCGKSFTRAEHLKGHSITHLGTKPFECPIDGCGAKFSARSSLYIHSKKHLQDIDASKTRCLVSSCNKMFTSKQSMKSHMVRQHNFSPDLLTQLEASCALTPSNELTSLGQNDLSNLDLSSIFTNVSSNGPGVSADLTLVNSGILTIDVSSVGSTLAGNLSANSSLVHPVDPLVLVSNNETQQSLESSLLLGAAASILQQGTLQLDDVQTVNAEALGSLASLSMRASSQDIQGLTSSNSLTIDSSTLTPSVNLGASSSEPELLTQAKTDRNLIPNSEVVGEQEGSKVVTQFVFPNPTGSYSAQKEMDYSLVAGSSSLESSGSARTDYRAIQLAKSKKNGGSTSAGRKCSLYATSGAIKARRREFKWLGWFCMFCLTIFNQGTSPTQRKSKSAKQSPVASSSGSRFGSNAVMPNGGLTLQDPATGAQFVQIQLLQDDPPGDSDLPFQLNAQSPASHAQLTVDLPVHILQEPHASTEEDAASDNSQFTGSTINLQDLE